MSRVASRLVRRSGVYQYRRRVPDDVRKLGGFNGREIFSVSLRTTDPVVARHEAAAREAWFELECAKARGVEPSSPRRPDAPADMVLTDEYLKAIQDRAVALSLASDITNALMAQDDEELLDELERRDAWAIPSYPVDAGGNIIDREGEGAEARIRRRELEEIARRIAPDLSYYAKKFGAEPSSLEYRRIEATLIEAEQRTLAARRSRTPGAVFSSAYRPADASGPPIKPESTWTIRALANRYLEVKPSGASWRHKIDVAVDLFEQFLDRPTPISAITRDHIREFMDLLAITPNRAKMRFPGLSLREAAQANRARLKPFPVISGNTIRDSHFAVLRVLFTYASGELGVITSDPTHGVRIRGATKKGGRGAFFEIDELSDLFKLPLFAGCVSPTRVTKAGTFRINDHRFWTPLIMLFSGARPSEIAQLAVSDVKLNTEYPSFSILTEFDENDPEERPYVLSFKTENARRNVPLHPTLIELGFADYVKHMLKDGHDRLFPAWQAPADARKLYSGATWVRQFNERLIPEITNKKPKPSIYSFRHTFKTQMAICHVPPQHQDKVLGHAGPRMDPTYLRHIPIQELYPEIAKVTYRGLDLSALKR